MTKLKFNHMLALASTMALMSGSHTVYAQQTQPTADVEEVVVTGFRRSLQNSITAKQDSTSIVEAVYAEDIGKLPDSSIAESLARMPGLAAQRLNGRSSSISIRGLGEDYSTTTLNGREQVSVGDNRGVEFDVYPSEIIGGVVVHKTPDATLMTQGIAGTINLETIKPLKQSERIISGSIRGEQNDMDALNADAENTGYRGVVSYIDQFNDDTVGVAVAVASMNSPDQEERWNSWGYTGDGLLGGAKPFARSGTLERDSFMGVLELQPTDQLHITADALYIDFRDESIMRGIELGGAFYTGPKTIDGPFSESVTVVEQGNLGGGLVEQGLITNTEPVVRNDYELREAELSAIGLNAEYELSDQWSVAGDFSYSGVERQVWSLESYSGTGRGTGVGAYDDIGYTLKSNGLVEFTHELDYSDDELIELGGPLSWGGGLANVDGAPSEGFNNGQDGFINLPEITDDLITLKLSAKRTFDGAVSSIDFGVNFSDREKVRDDTGVFLTLRDYPDTTPVPDEYRIKDTSLDFVGLGDMVSYRSFDMYNDGFYHEIEENLTAPNRERDSWTVTEKTATAFAKVNFETELGATPIRGNVGLQVIDTEQGSTGNAVSVVDGLVVATERNLESSFFNFLPSFNLIADVADGQSVRFGFARTMSRSRLDRMNAGYGYSFEENRRNGTTAETGPWTASGGNVDLRPLEATQLDLSYENYFSSEGYVSGALFYKQLDNWQGQDDVEISFADIPVPGGGTVGTTQGMQQQWVNVEGGHIQGGEIATALPANLITDVLDGMGLVLSGTFVRSDIADGSVPGLSKEVYNATFYYEKAGFQFRTSLRKRSAFRGQVNAISFSRTDVVVLGDEIVDMQLGYDFSEIGVEGLNVTLQLQNLTDEPFITTFDGNRSAVRDYQSFGKNYLLGASYKF